MSDLIQRCKEILAWKKTGLLKGDALHSFANKKWGEDHFALQLAESDTVNEALETLVAQPDPISNDTALIQQMLHALLPHELQTHAAEVAIEAARKRLGELPE